MAPKPGALWADAPPVGEPRDTLSWLRDRLGPRRRHLFACACCRIALQYQTEVQWYDVLEALEQRAEKVSLGPRLDPPRPSRRVARSNVAGVWALEALWSLRRGGEWGGLPSDEFLAVIDH